MRIALVLGGLLTLAVILPVTADERVVLHDTDVAVDQTLIAGTSAALFVAVRGATDLDRSEPIAGATVRVVLGERVVVSGTTDAAGQLTARFVVPRLPAGPVALVVFTRSAIGQDRITRQVLIADKSVIHLRTDRGEYRPGQILRWRVTALATADAHPLAAEKIAVVIADPRGTEVWRGEVVTSGTGMASGAVPLADDLLLGRYRVRASSASASTQEDVKVKSYRLAPFTVRVESDTPPPVVAGTSWRGTVVARYPYGEPVAGEVSVAFDPGDGSSGKMTGKLDEHGRFPLELTIAGEAPARVEARVVDGAARSATAKLDLAARPDGLTVAVVPERHDLAAGQPAAVTIITSDGQGSFVPARVWLKIPGQPHRIERTSTGVVRLSITPPRAGRELMLTATATTADGRVGSDSAEVTVGEAGARAVHLAEAVVPAGAPIAVSGRWSAPRGPVVATLIRGDAPLAGSVATIDADGRLTASLTPPPGAYGLATVRLVELAWNPKDGRVEAASERATVYLTPAALDVKIDGAARFTPGTDAKLAVTVRDAAGRPAAGVGLAASVVDERVLALSEPRPDLPTVLRGMDVEDARAAGIAFAELAGRAGEPDARDALRAIVEALPPAPAEAELRLAAALRFGVERERMQRVSEAVYPLLLGEARAIGVKTAAGWDYATPLPELIARAAVPATDRQTPWRQPTAWGYGQRLLPELAFADVAARVAEERLDQLAQRLWQRRKAARRLLRDGTLAALADRGVVGRNLVVDPWGTPLQLERGMGTDTISAGPDLLFGTKDDLRRDDVFGEVFGRYGSVGYGSGGGGGFGAGRGAVSPRVMMGSGPAEAAVRARFDETVLWLAGVETDAGGRAVLDVPLADSITGWQVDVEAVAALGATGAARARMETFLPLSVDADVPAELAAGDEYELPVVVANHAGAARTLTVGLEAEGAIERRGEGSRTVTLPSGTTLAVAFPLRAREPGDGVVRITLSDGRKGVDAVRRPIRVEAAGSLVRLLQTGAAGEGAAPLAFVVPEGAGAVNGRVRLFRGAMDQATDGLEGMLREPHGCFEQTSSSTYPNLLVLRLIDKKPGLEAVRERARDLVGKGYQRLISYEVRGGGFSWFGDEPANQVLTAYGLLEFADMAAVYPVDPELIERTRKWLLSKQLADGSWAADKNWLHDWSAVQGRLSTTAYVAWALAESGWHGKALTRALALLRSHAGAVARDPYLLALWASAESAAGTGDRTALAALARQGVKEGDALVYRAGGKTLFYATGRGADAQVTALAATALSRTGGRADARRALAWLWAARSPSYGWGTTQGTVLALRAAAVATPPGPPPTGEVRVVVDGKEQGRVDLGSVDVPSLGLMLAPGKHAVALVGPKGVALDADLRASWRTASDAVPVASGIEVLLDSAADPVAVGTKAEMKVVMKNPGKEAIAMPTLVVPVPPGWRVDAESMDKLVTDKRVARWEDQGAELHVYLTELRPWARVELPYRLEAAVKSRVTQRAVQAYAYYSPEVRGVSAAAVLTAR